MRIGLGVAPCYANILLANYCLRTLNIKFSTFIISRAPFCHKGKAMSGIETWKFFLKRYGLYRNIVNLFELLPLVSLDLRNLFKSKKGLWTFERLAKEFNIKIIEHENFNSDEFRARLKEEDIDIFLLAGVDQILKAETINIPKKACLNFHTSILPEYKGVDPIFQKMLNDPSYQGITLHKVIPKIDQGDILLQRKIITNRNNSYFKNLNKLMLSAGGMLKQLIESKSWPNLVIQHSRSSTPYRSFPTRKEIKTFQKKGLKFISIKEVLNSFLFRSLSYEIKRLDV